MLFSFNLHFHGSGKWVRSIENRNWNTILFHIWEDISRFTLLTLDFLDPRQGLSRHITQITNFFPLFLQTPCSTWMVNRQHEVFTNPLTAKLQLKQSWDQEWALLLPVTDIPLLWALRLPQGAFLLPPLPNYQPAKRNIPFSLQQYYHHDSN